MIFIYSPSAPLPSSGRFLWNAPKPSLVLTNWNNCVSFHLIICSLLWIVNAADSCETFAMQKINQFGSYKKKLRQVQTNLTEAIHSITALRSPPSPFAGGSCPTQSWQEGAHTCPSCSHPQFSVLAENPGKFGVHESAGLRYAARWDAGTQPFWQRCCRSGNLQGEEADSQDKREYCKAAVAFFLWPSESLQDHYSEMQFLRDSSLMIQANLKLHQQWKGSLSLTQHVVLPRINTEGIRLEVNHANNNKKPKQKHLLFSEGSLNEPSSPHMPALTGTEDKNAQGSEGRRRTEHEGWVKKKKWQKLEVSKVKAHQSNSLPVPLMWYLDKVH